MIQFESEIEAYLSFIEAWRRLGKLQVAITQIIVYFCRRIPYLNCLLVIPPSGAVVSQTVPTVSQASLDPSIRNELIRSPIVSLGFLKIPKSLVRPATGKKGPGVLRARVKNLTEGLHRLLILAAPISFPAPVVLSFRFIQRPGV